jgi:hypothetical protein
MNALALVVCGALLVLSAPTIAQRPSQGEVDPLLGTWHLNVARSTYRPGPPPVAQTRS